MPTQVSLLDGALASAGTLAIQTNGTTSAITISSAQVATFVNNPIMTGLTASRAVFTDGSKGLTSNAITGTGNVVMSASPTLTGTIDGAALTLSSSLTLSGGTANGVLYLNGSKVATSGSALTFDGTTFATQAVSATGITNNVNLLSLKDSGTSYTNGNNFAYLTNSTNAVVGALYHPEITSLGISGNSALVFGIGSTPAEQMRLTSTGLGIGTSSPANKLQVVASSSGTNDLLTISRFDRGSSGTAANGLGGRLEFSAQDNAGSQRTAAWLNWKLADVSSGGPKGYLSLGSRGTSEALIIDDSGNLGLGVTPSAWSNLKSLDISTFGGFYGYTNQCGMTSNAYYGSGGWTYKNAGSATLYAQIGGAHQWSTAPSSTGAITFTQAMTLDASGNLVVGGTSALVSTSGRGNITINGTSESILAFGIGGTNSGYIYSTASALTINAQPSRTLNFETGGAERARIDSSGNFMVGQTSTNRRFAATHNVANYTAEIGNSNGTPYGIYVLYGGAAPNNTGSQFFTAVDTGGTRFDVRSNGGLANYSANDVNLSDRREKTNFAPAGEYLSKICAIPVQTFNYIDQNLEEDAGLTLGVVAQDVQAVAPELVMESNWGTEENPKMRLSIYQTDLQYALMKCIQEQQAIIEQLKARLDAANL